MRIFRSRIPILFALTVRAWPESVQTGATIDGQHICSPQYHAAYRYLMGDEFEETGYYSVSHQNTAENVCASEQCSECEFCDLGLNGRFPILSLQNVELNKMANFEARIKTYGEEPTNCKDCQRCLDNCARPDARNVEYSRPRHEDDLPYSPPETDHRTTLQCELLLCTAGPTHCGVNGQCERRICKDLAAGAGLLQPAHVLECKDCLKPWVECIHDRCFSPTHDAFANRLPGLDCFGKDGEECQQYSWQELNARVAPDPGCVARCWAKTPTRCHAGSCALAFSESTSQIFTAPPLTAAQHHLETVARGCNTFRNTCLETCDLGTTYSRCMENCKELHGAFPKYRERCEDTCEEKTCRSECSDMTCCIGPEHCRKGREAYRCTEKGLSCGRYKHTEDGTVWRKA